MLILRRFKLAYACQHEALEHHLGPGITAIRGSNGSGKSNLVELIRASVTNDFGGMEGNKLDNICRSLPTGSPSYVETEWEVDAGMLVLRRALANATTELRLNGDVIANKENVVTEQAFRLMGIQPKVFKDFLFADYIKLIQLASGNKESRAELIQSLCGLEVVDKLDRHLRDAVSADTALASQYDPAELDLELRTWGEHRLAIRELTAANADLAAFILSEETQRSCRNKLVQQERFSMYQAELAKANDRLRKAKQVSTDGVELSKASRELKAADAALTESQTSLGMHEQNHRDYLAYQGYQKASSQLQARIEQPGPVAPKPTQGLSMDYAQATTSIALANERIRETNEALTLIDDGREITCPTCLRTLKPSPPYLEFLNSRLAEAQQQLSVAKECSRAWQTYETQESLYRTAAAVRERALADAKADLLQLVKPDRQGKQDTGQVEQLRAVVKRNKADAVKWSQAKLAAIAQQAAAEARIEAAETDISSHTASLAAVGKPQSEASLKQIQLQLARHEEHIDVFNSQRSKLAVKRTQAFETAGRIRRLRRQRRSLQRLSQWVETLKRSRDVFKRDRLPARVVAGMLHRTTAKLNEYLGQLSVPFSVVADPAEFSFLATHNDGTVERAKRLSTGQSLCLGISFWLARADVFSGQLPFFCFDEPTSNLDDEHVVSVAELFSYLAGDLIRKHRQGLVITHHEALARCATHVIQL